jgi:hypothetical protein
MAILDQVISTRNYNRVYIMNDHSVLGTEWQHIGFTALQTQRVFNFKILILGFCHDVDEMCAILGYYAA